jgi:hypothetical protein
MIKGYFISDMLWCVEQLAYLLGTSTPVCAQQLQALRGGCLRLSFLTRCRIQVEQPKLETRPSNDLHWQFPVGYTRHDRQLTATVPSRQPCCRLQADKSADVGANLNGQLVTDSLMTTILPLKEDALAGYPRAIKPASVSQEFSVEA